MFEGFDEWLGAAHQAGAEYAEARRAADQAEAVAAAKLAKMIEAYRWPENVPEPGRPEAYQVSHLMDGTYGEDLAPEIAVATKASVTSAQYLVMDVDTLANRLPLCWAKIIDGQAPLWQGRRIAEACAGLNMGQCGVVDEMVSPALGAVGFRRLSKLLRAALMQADPDHERFKHADPPDRFARIKADESDPMTGWLIARLDKADAIFLDAIIQAGADKFATLGDTGTNDERRARALGIMANPAAAVQLLGVPTTRGMNPVPQSAADVAAFIAHTANLVAAYTPKTVIHVHLCGANLGDPDQIARIEGIGPLLAEHIRDLTAGTKITVKPVIHLDDTTIGVDQYEIPNKIRQALTLRQPYDCFPWSSIESRHLDVDHTVPWQPGQPNQTRIDNLAPLSRTAHRVKTHCGWQLSQPQPGVTIWHTPAGQAVQVDHTGSHPLPPDTRC